jgi:hypothetical protein
MYYTHALFKNEFYALETVSPNNFNIVFSVSNLWFSSSFNYSINKLFISYIIVIIYVWDYYLYCFSFVSVSCTERTESPNLRIKF